MVLWIHGLPNFISSESYKMDGSAVVAMLIFFGLPRMEGRQIERKVHSDGVQGNLNSFTKRCGCVR
jgi:hypothetical protein